MKTRLLALILTISLVWTAGAQTKAVLLHRFRLADKQATWSPTTLDLRLARRLLSDPRASSISKASAAFCLSVKTPSNNGYVNQLVKSAMKVEEGRECLPGALSTVLTKGNSDAAWKYFCTLDLDGAAAEILSDTRIDVYMTDPERVMRHWSALKGKDRKQLVDCVVNLCEDDPNELNWLRKKSLRGSPALKQFYSEVKAELASS